MVRNEDGPLPHMEPLCFALAWRILVHKKETKRKHGILFVECYGVPRQKPVRTRVSEPNHGSAQFLAYADFPGSFLMELR